MKKIIPLIFLWRASMESFAQQDPLYAQYLNNPFLLNPAYAGMSNNLSATFSYRQQWTGYEGNPKTLSASGHLSMHENRMGAGLILLSDRAGATTFNEVLAAYAYRIKLSHDNILSFGLQAGITNINIENSKLLLQDPTDPYFIGETNETKPTTGAGLILTGDRLLLGVSVPRMLKAHSTIDGMERELYTQHFYGMASYVFFINDHVRFKPSLLTKVVKGAPVSIDVNAAFTFHERYTAGVLTRNFTTYGLLLQGAFNSFRLGYAMELPSNKSIGTRFLTHEVTIGLRTNIFDFHQNTITSF